MFDGRNRSKKYDDLKWVKNESYLKKIIGMCDLQGHETVCDVGTGTGVVAEALARYCDTVIAIDKSPSMLEIAREKRSAPNIRYEMRDYIMWENNDMFDCIVARMAFHHFDNIGWGMVSSKHLLKSKGKLIIAEGIPAIGTEAWYMDMFRFKETRNLITVDKLVNVLEHYGFKAINFEIIKDENVSMMNWLKSASLSDMAIKRISDMHRNAPDYVKKAYDMEIDDDDVFMTWRSVIIRGEKK